MELMVRTASGGPFFGHKNTCQLLFLLNSTQMHVNSQRDQKTASISAHYISLILPEAHNQMAQMHADIGFNCNKKKCSKRAIRIVDK